MKKILTICLFVVSSLVNAMESDLFAKANELYANSDWGNAKKLYKSIHKQIESGAINKNDIEKEALIRGHVNYADVLWALGVAKWDAGEKEDARDNWMLACKHWAYRLEGRQFGRTPLTDEWNGSDPSNKKIVVFSERDSGAFGDTFLMSFLLRYLKKRGATIYFVPQAPLKKLYENKELLHGSCIDAVYSRSEQLPGHNSKIYLWSLLNYYIGKATDPFPVEGWLSGPDDLGICKTILEKYTNSLLVGFWYRSSTNAAADYRALERNLGADRVLTTLGTIPHVTLICLEGAGHFPINKEDYTKHKENSTAGNLDEIDVTSHSTSQVVIFPSTFDQGRGAFVDTFSVMNYIKQKGGLLIGCDTGLLNAAAGIKKADGNTLPSVCAVLNGNADFRWGSKKKILENGSVEPRPFYLSNDVIVYQAPTQGAFDFPLQQIKSVVEKRAENYQAVIKK